LAAVWWPTSNKGFKGDLFFMTLDLNTLPPIVGESALIIRDILRRASGGFREDWLTDKFRYDSHRAHEIANAMEAAASRKENRMESFLNEIQVSERIKVSLACLRRWRIRGEDHST